MNNLRPKKSQIAIEFMLLSAIGIVVVITFLIVVLKISQENTDVQKYNDMDDLGKSLQHEFILASQMEDGYIRRLNIPTTINDENYTISLATTAKTTSLILTSGIYTAEYLIPSVNGTIIAGTTYLYKINGTLYMNQS